MVAVVEHRGWLTRVPTYSDFGFQELQMAGRVSDCLLAGGMQACGLRYLSPASLRRSLFAIPGEREPAATNFPTPWGDRAALTARGSELEGILKSVPLG